MFQDKTVLVTGGSRGIGRAVVEELAAAGANVAFTYGANAQAAESLLTDLRQAHPHQRFLAYRCDARDEEATVSAVEDIIDRCGGIDVLVNNAGITRDNLLVAMSSEEWRDVIDINLNGVFAVSQCVVFQMMKQKAGSIVNITSVAGLYGNAGQVNYASSKAGLVGFTRALAKEVVGSGIRVNAVAPGFIETDMTDAMGEAQKGKITTSIGMRRMGSSEEVAKTVSFLASGASSYITGQVLAVDGGIVL